MKRLFIVCFASILFASLCACRTRQVAELPEPRDATATVEGAFSPDGYTLLSPAPVVGPTAELSILHPYQDLYPYYANSPIAIDGKVVGEVQYTDQDAQPWSFFTFQALAVYKGDLEVDTLITVAVPNGCIRLSTYAAVHGDTAPYGSFPPEETEAGLVTDPQLTAPLLATGVTGTWYTLFLDEPEAEGRTADAYVVRESVQNSMTGRLIQSMIKNEANA